MGDLSVQLLNGALIDSNGLVQKVVDQGRIPMSNFILHVPF
jgi:hypothetical protein